MGDARTYPSGVPCWIDTEQPDPSAAAHFYGTLFGWTFEDAVPAEAPGSYLIATLRGKDVAAIAPGTAGEATWSTYIAVDDADSIATTITEAGGQMTSPPQDAGPGGRAASFVDPTGAPVRGWQARRRLGAQLANASGSWNFSDLHTGDLATAKTFYATVFGWEADDRDVGGGQQTVLWRRPGYGRHLAATSDPDIHSRQKGVAAPSGFADAIAWLAPLREGETPHWHVTFAVADRDDAVSTALRLGATEVFAPVDTPWTKMAVIRDPQGAPITLSQFTPPS
jgi:predicted enzyme related to lactoylglutathione lyase